ncbi:MAG TPA: hypothetical protein VMA98_13900 [Candidatus Acidoferrales bacterium]|nr:hypothetical protein [Candidatus Acidoferrales bacterium]
MKHASLRIWFAVAVAVISAAIADPLVEAASNAGWFGSANFTDHSNLDVIPALLSGAILLGIALVLRVRRELLRASSEALRTHLARLLPAVFMLQLGVLFAMETIEQTVVAGRALGGSIWLGGPVWFSLSVHALVCVAVAFVLARAVRACARTTVRVIRRLRALALRALHGPAPLALRRHGSRAVDRSAPALRRAGNRAPPFQLV